MGTLCRKGSKLLWQMTRRASIWLTLSVVAACSPQVNVRGHVAPAGEEVSVKPDTMSREDVRSLLGSPSSISSFGEETWYYISSRKENMAFLKPEIVDQQVTRITFDADGMVKKVETYDKNAAQHVDVVDRETPTEGHSLGVVEQLLGNLGRFNKSRNATQPRNRRGRGY